MDNRALLESLRQVGLTEDLETARHLFDKVQTRIEFAEDYAKKLIRAWDDPLFMRHAMDLARQLTVLSSTLTIIEESLYGEEDEEPYEADEDGQ